MKVEPYNFFFHPLHNEHTQEVTALSLMTNLVLTVLSNGWYLLIVGAVHTRECVMTHEKANEATDAKAKRTFDKVFPPETRKTEDSDDKFVGLQAFIDKHKDCLEKLKRHGEQGNWKHLQTHTGHPDSLHDWYMYPIDRASRTYGEKYRVTSRYRMALQNNPEFMSDYRDGLILGAKSFGFDIVNGRDFDAPSLKWRGHIIRLAKMLQSAREFGQKDLHDSLVDFVYAHHLDQEMRPWMRKYLRPIPESEVFVV